MSLDCHSVMLLIKTLYKLFQHTHTQNLKSKENTNMEITSKKNFQGLFEETMNLFNMIILTDRR